MNNLKQEFKILEWVAVHPVLITRDDEYYYAKLHLLSQEQLVNESKPINNNRIFRFAIRRSGIEKIRKDKKALNKDYQKYNNQLTILHWFTGILILAMLSIILAGSLGFLELINSFLVICILTIFAIIITCAESYLEKQKNQ